MTHKDYKPAKLFGTKNLFDQWARDNQSNIRLVTNTYGWDGADALFSVPMESYKHFSINDIGVSTTSADRQTLLISDGSVVINPARSEPDMRRELAVGFEIVAPGDDNMPELYNNGQKVPKAWLMRPGARTSLLTINHHTRRVYYGNCLLRFMTPDSEPLADNSLYWRAGLDSAVDNADDRLAKHTRPRDITMYKPYKKTQQDIDDMAAAATVVKLLRDSGAIKHAPYGSGSRKYRVNDDADFATPEIIKYAAEHAAEDVEGGKLSMQVVSLIANWTDKTPVFEAVSVPYLTLDK